MAEYRVEVAREIAEAARPTRAYFIMTGLATVLASYGLLANSPAVIIGAMLVAMLLNPITGLSYAFVTADAALVRRAGIAEFLGAVLVFAIGFVVGSVHHDLPITQEMLVRCDPTLLDLVIAIAGGAAVSYATGNLRLNSALAGVAIATALVPPLANAGMLMAHGEPHLAAGALLLYVSNYASVLLAAMVVFWLLGHRPDRETDTSMRLVRAGRLGQLALFVVLSAQLALRLADQIEARTRLVEVEESLSVGLARTPGARLIDVRIAPRTAPQAIVAVVRTPQPVTPAEVAKLELALPAGAKGDLRLRVRSIPVVVANSDGYLYVDDLM